MLRAEERREREMPAGYVGGQGEEGRVCVRGGEAIKERERKEINMDEKGEGD